MTPEEVTTIRKSILEAAAQLVHLSIGFKGAKVLVLAYTDPSKVAIGGSGDEPKQLEIALAKALELVKSMTQPKVEIHDPQDGEIRSLRLGEAEN